MDSSLDDKTDATAQIAGSALKKEKCIPSVGKVKTTDSWDTHDVVLIDYLEKDKSISRLI